jgi:hypothetical protein
MCLKILPWLKSKIRYDTSLTFLTTIEHIGSSLVKTGLSQEKGLEDFKNIKKSTIHIINTEYM